jgi:sterol 24-C-methyltransferase
MIGLKAGMKVLDVGCGVGGPAREIARFSDANITGSSLAPTPFCLWPTLRCEDWEKLTCWTCFIRRAGPTGVSLNDFQIGRARKYTKKAGLQDQVQFQQGNFMELSKQFGEQSFDAGTSIFRFPVLCQGGGRAGKSALSSQAIA